MTFRFQFHFYMPKPLGKSVTIKISQRVFNENNTNRRELLCGCQGKVGRVDCVCVSTMHCLGPCVWRQRDDRHVCICDDLCKCSLEVINKVGVYIRTESFTPQ